MPQSGLERFLTAKVYKLRAMILLHDRAVLVGTALAFVPIFPACTLGLIVSIANLALIKFGFTRKIEYSLTLFGIVAGAINTLIWLLIFPNLLAVLFPITLAISIIEAIKAVLLSILFILIAK